MKRLPLSVFIIAKNEADRIGRTIDSVREWVDEVVVIDSGSSDETVRIAGAHGARVVFHEWAGYGPQKRFGEDQCRNYWLLNLDADEEVSPSLAAEIKALFAAGEPACPAYVVQVRDLLPGEEKLAPFAHTNRCLRLYHRKKARFSDSPVHDSVIVEEGEPGALAQPVLHRSFRSIAHAIEKMNSYSSVQAENLKAKGGLALPTLRLMVEIPVAFFKVYVLRGYILRGRRGYVYSVLYAFGRFVRVAKSLKTLK